MVNPEVTRDFTGLVMDNMRVDLGENNFIMAFAESAKFLFFLT